MPVDRDREAAELISHLRDLQTRERDLQEKVADVVQRIGGQLRRSTLTDRDDWDRLAAAAREYRAERNLLRLVAGVAADTADLSPQAFVAAAARAIDAMPRVERGAVFLFDGKGEPEVMETLGDDTEDRKVIAEQLSSGIVAQVWDQGEEVYCKEAVADADLKQLHSVVHHHLQTVLCCPIQDEGGRVRGALYLENRSLRDAFPDAWREAVRMLAAQMAQQLALLSMPVQHEDPTASYRRGGRYREIVGCSAVTAQLLASIDEVVQRDPLPTVLIVGETGVGKDLTAQALHCHGPRRRGPFEAINMASLPETLADAELFGSRKGAFTDAVTRDGLFVKARGGILFLDEIGEASPEVQAKLLRVLDTRRVRPLGGGAEVPVDVWVVAATNRDLVDAVDQGTFRRDLYYRLAQEVISIPPLRERPEDVDALVRHFVVEESAGREGPTPFVSPELMVALQGMRLDGNVRELHGLVQMVVNRTDGALLTLAELRKTGRKDALGKVGALEQTWDGATAEFQRRYLAWVVQQSGGSASAVARVLGISRPYVYKLGRRYGVDIGGVKAGGKER